MNAGVLPSTLDTRPAGEFIGFKLEEREVHVAIGQKCVGVLLRLRLLDYSHLKELLEECRCSSCILGTDGNVLELSHVSLLSNPLRWSGKLSSAHKGKTSKS